MNEDKAGRRQKRGGNMPHVALDFAAAEEELGATVIDPEKIVSPESLEGFFEKEWVRSLFALAVEDLRQLCEQRERARTFRLFEAYDLEGNEKSSAGRRGSLPLFERNWRESSLDRRSRD